MLARDSAPGYLTAVEPRRLSKFSLVGLTGVGVTMGCMWLFTSVFGLFYAASAVITTLLSITNNFVWNDVWTFRDRRTAGAGALLIRWGKFTLARSTNFFIGMGVLVLFVEVFGINYLVVTIFAIIGMTLINYFLGVVWVWRRHD